VGKSLLLWEKELLEKTADEGTTHRDADTTKAHNVAIVGSTLSVVESLGLRGERAANALLDGEQPVPWRKSHRRAQRCTAHPSQQRDQRLLDEVWRFLWSLVLSVHEIRKNLSCLLKHKKKHVISTLVVSFFGSSVYVPVFQEAKG
jgi:hypothetical protein